MAKERDGAKDNLTMYYSTIYDVICNVKRERVNEDMRVKRRGRRDEVKGT